MSRLTIPLAQTAPGRSAPVLTPEPRGGEIVAEFGRRLGAIGDALETERLDRQMARLQVDLERDIMQARLEAEEIGSPDRLETFWTERTAALRQTYLSDTGEDGRPRVDPRNQERFGLAFDSVTNRHAASIGARALEQRRAERVALFSDWEAAVTPQAARGTPDEAAAILEEFDTQVDAQVEAGLIDAATGADRKRAKRGELAEARATYLLSADPVRLSAAIEAGEFDALEATDQAKWKTRADKAIATAEEAAAREANQAEADRLKEVKRLAGEAVTLAGKGERSAVEDELLADSGFAAQHPVEFQELAAAAKLRDAKGDLSAMTIPELEALLAELEAAPKTEGFDVNAQEYVAKLIEERRKGFREDPIQYAIENELPGFSGLALPDDLLADMGATARALDLHAARGEQLAGATLPNGEVLPQYLDRPPAVPLTREGQERVKAALAPGAGDPARQAELAALLVETLGPQAPSALGLDPELIHAGGMMAAGVSADTAASVMRGRTRLAQDTAIRAQLRPALEVFREKNGALLDAMPGGETATSQILDAALALYADRHPVPEDPLGSDFERNFAQAVHEVLGGTGRPGKRDQTGGIGEINGADTFLPLGVSPRDVQAGFDDLADLLDGREFDLSGGSRPEWEAADRVVSAATSGADLRLNGLELVADDWESLRLVPIGNDRYQLARMVNGRELTVTDARTGSAAVLSIDAMLRALEPEMRTIGDARAAEDERDLERRRIETIEAPVP